jgi:hypothetical protein
VTRVVRMSKSGELVKNWPIALWVAGSVLIALVATKCATVSFGNVLWTVCVKYCA